MRLLGVDVAPHHPELPAGAGEVHVEVALAFERHDLEPAALLEGAGLPAAVVRDEAVEKAHPRAGPAFRRGVVGDDLGVGVGQDCPAEVVLGQVGDAGPRVDVHGLVGEEAHISYGGFGEVALRVARVHLEDVAVVLSSSQVSQVPHGVAPPAQLLSVPEEET